MRLLGLILLSIAVFAGCFELLARAMGSRDSLYPFWVGAAVSVATLAAGMFLGMRRFRPGVGISVLAVATSLGIVSVGDILVAVAFACSHGDCI